MKHKLLDLSRRILILLLVVWTVVSLVTLLIELVPGDPATATLGEDATAAQIEQFREKHNLDRPAFFFSYARDAASGERDFRWHGMNNRYIDYWGMILRGDMGRSFRSDCPITKAIFGRCGGQAATWNDVFSDFLQSRFVSTAQLAIVALIVAVSISIPLGVIAGKNRGTWLDNALSVIALVGISTPGFVLGPLFIYLFALQLGWLAPSGRNNWEDIILPAVTLGAALSALLTRMVRSSVIEEMGEDYVRTARAKGLSERTVVYKHVLKNGLIPVVTILGLQLGVLLAGAIITEKIFNWPGLGLLLIDDGIGKRDYRLVQGCVLVISVTYIFANTLTDIIYRWLDPRIRIQ
ncbi:MAG: peptide/nickel transport system permease protein [Pyrinomonadaceae bacterium]|nr:peptide/nickel transport system permease protein [Pyrinomonadaceae bacterium]